jgi:hypothetical protein
MNTAQQKARVLADQYMYRVFWSPEDEEFVATCAEWPRMSWLDRDKGNALNGLVKSVADEIAVRFESGDEIPEPIASRNYSGKFQVRVPPEIHRKLVLESSEQHISLNRLVSSKLAR